MTLAPVAGPSTISDAPHFLQRNLVLIFASPLLPLHPPSEPAYTRRHARPVRPVLRSPNRDRSGGRRHHTADRLVAGTAAPVEAGGQHVRPVRMAHRHRAWGRPSRRHGGGDWLAPAKATTPTLTKVSRAVLWMT